MAGDATCRQHSMCARMKVLAFDTALGACSAAVVEAGRCIAREQRIQSEGQAEALLPLIERVLAASNSGYGNLDLIAVTVGPGTFTGLRIGLAAARGLRLATGLPVAGVTTLAALAASVSAEVRRDRAILAVIDARRGEVYAQAFGPEFAPLCSPQLLDVAAAACLLPEQPAVLVGSGALLLAPLLGERDVIAEAGLINPDPVAIAAVALRGGPWSAEAPPPVPLYLRAPDARLP